MTLKLAINGFGRIGRLAARALFESGRNDIELVAINDPGGNFFPLLKYDSIHGPATFSVEKRDEDHIIIDGKPIKRLRDRDPANLDWASYDVDVLMECTGRFRDRESASLHLKSGAKKVLISAPGEDDDITVVYGVNHKDIKKEHLLVSNASCTTNCLAPVALVLNRAIGIKHGFMTTIHSYTGDQNLIDSSHKDPLRARAAALNMIPTTTGAAKAVGKVLPELEGKLDGAAIRVPTPNVSLVDLKFTSLKPTSKDEINAAIKGAADGDLKNILACYSEPLVSSDFNHNPHSSIFSLNDTKVIDDTFCRVMSWYDNEWGFACRMLDTAIAMHKTGY